MMLVGGFIFANPGRMIKFVNMVRTDKQIMLDILSGAFRESDRLRPILRKGRTEKRLKIMAAYAYDVSKKFDGIFLSSDKSTGIIYWRKSTFKRSLADHLKYAWMFLRTIKLHKLFETARRERYVEARRPDIDDYYYVWLLGKNPSVRGLQGLADIRDHLNEIMNREGIPILIETTVEKLLKLYRYVGFEIYDQFFDETIGMEVYYLRKDPARSSPTYK